MQPIDYSKRISTVTPSAIREILKVTQDPTVISFAAGNPATESFPAKEFNEIISKILTERPGYALQYGISEGYPVLRTLLKKRLWDKYGIGQSFDDTIIVTGGQQGIEMTAKTLLDDGDTLVCEEPSFLGALNAFRSYNAVLKGIPVEKDGLDLEKLEALLKEDKRVKLVYVIPTFQNPSGRVMSLAKRKALLELAERYNFMILEDNPYYDLRYDGEVVPTIKSLDKTGRVVYCGSFSKVIAPGIRVGYVTAPDWMIAKLTVAKQLSDVHTNLLMQMVIAEYLEKYDLDAHVESIIELYRPKRDLMINLLNEHCGNFMQIEKPEGGLFIWATLPEGYDGTRLCKIAGGYKVAAVPGSSFCVNDSQPYPAIRLNFSLPTMEQIEKGCAFLGEACKFYQKEV
ncbi:MAG: PLP-dependent aminotransferase family protein [Clostridia bacterium]|nr:PLP-dependent aminotransferase family protein [Clostridia bacterium]